MLWQQPLFLEAVAIRPHIFLFFLNPLCLLWMSVILLFPLCLLWMQVITSLMFALDEVICIKAIMLTLDAGHVIIKQNFADHIVSHASNISCASNVSCASNIGYSWDRASSKEEKTSQKEKYCKHSFLWKDKDSVEPSLVSLLFSLAISQIIFVIKLQRIGSKVMGQLVAQ